jgi:hypothetical protein
MTAPDILDNAAKQKDFFKVGPLVQGRSDLITVFIATNCFFFDTYSSRTGSSPGSEITPAAIVHRLGQG